MADESPSLVVTEQPGPQGTPSQPPTPAVVAARPDWLPEPYWDNEKNAPKTEYLSKDFADLQTLRSEQEARQKDIPQDGAYRFELPESFKLPADVKYQPPAVDDPQAKAFFSLGKNIGLTQTQMRELLGFEASRQLSEFQNRQRAEASRVTELKALGDNAGARVEQAQRWLNANLSEAEAKTLGFALNMKDGVLAIEKIIEAMKGVTMRGMPSGNGHVAEDDVAGKRLRAMYPTMFKQ